MDFRVFPWLRKEKKEAQTKVWGINRAKWLNEFNQRERGLFTLDWSTFFRGKSTVPNRVLLWNSIQLSFFMKAAFFIRPSSSLIDWEGGSEAAAFCFRLSYRFSWMPSFLVERQNPRPMWMNIHATVSNEKSSLSSRQISLLKKQMRFHGLALGANIRSINYGHKEVSSGR